MKSSVFCLLRIGVLIGAISGQPLFVIAADEIVAGNLTVEGDIDIEGSTLSLGTRSDSSTTPGLNLLYSDAAAPLIYFGATRNNASWLWQGGDSKTQMKLGEGNKLQLFDQASAPVAKIILDPMGASLFSGSVTFGGTTTFNGAFNAAGAISFSGPFNTSGSVHIGGGIMINGPLVVESGNVGVGNDFQDGATGFMSGRSNTIGGVVFQDLADAHFHSICSDSVGFYIDGDVRAELTSPRLLRTYFSPVPRSWYMQISNIVYGSESITFEIADLVNASLFTFLSDWGVEYNFVSMIAKPGGGAVVTVPNPWVVMPEDGSYVEFLSYPPGDPLWGTWALDGTGISSVSYSDGKTRFLLLGQATNEYYAGGQLMLMMSTPLSASGSVVYGNSNATSAMNAQAIGIGNHVVDIMEGYGFGEIPSGAYGYNNLVSVSGAYAFGANIQNSTPRSVQIGSSNSGKITISAEGYLGIGTETPSWNLDVVGGTSLSGDVVVVGAVHMASDVVVDGKVRIKPSGDLSMGSFTAGGSPAQ